MTTTPEKRPAYEPAASLVQPVGYDPDMKRPAATVAGGVLVLLRALAGLGWLVTVALMWDSVVAETVAEVADQPADVQQAVTELMWAALVVLLVGGALVYAVEGLFGVLIMRGRNLPRMIVMFFSVLSISVAFTGWWLQGQDIRIQTTLVTVALDILILLALSSRNAAAYARRNERR